MKMEKLQQWLVKLKKYKYAALIMILGIVLMSVPVSGKKQKQVVKQNTEEKVSLEMKIEQILSQVEGVGKVSVLLTEDIQEQYTYQENVYVSSTEEETETKSETVICTGPDEEEPIVVQIALPVYRGALVVCQGADKASVRLNVIQAVSGLTGLSSDKVTVIKMKND